MIDAWATDLLQRFQGRPIAIALELNKGPIVEALRTYDGLVLFHINPMMLARYREAGIHIRRDSWVSVMYAEELNSGKSSVTLQRTDRHGSMGQKSADFQLSL